MGISIFTFASLAAKTLDYAQSSSD